MKTILGALALLLAGVAPGYAQEVSADSITDAIRTEAVRMRGFIRAAETQGTKVVALIDSLLALPADTSGVPAAPDTVFVTDTLPGDTVIVQECPDGWTCTPPEEPPDTTAAVPMPTGVSLMGYAAPDMLHPREHGLHVEWDDAPVDRWRVRFGRNDTGESWGPDTVTTTSYRQELPADEPAGLIWGCTRALIDGRPDSEPGCDSFEWSPIRYGQFAVELHVGQEPLAPGDSVNIEVSRVDGGWADGSVAHPDSVVFETGPVRVREQVFPYRFPNDDDLFEVPAADSLIINWTVFPSPPGMQGGSVAYPVVTETSNARPNEPESYRQFAGSAFDCLEGCETVGEIRVFDPNGRLSIVRVEDDP